MLVRICHDCVRSGHATRYVHNNYRGVEQLEARLAHTQKVAGSSPVSAISYRMHTIWTVYMRKF